MRLAISSLYRNLLAGLRLSLFLPVTRLQFRIDLVQLLLLFVFSALIDVAGDWSRTVPPRELSLLGAGTGSLRCMIMMDAGVSPVKGGFPVNIWKRMIPRL